MPDAPHDLSGLARDAVLGLAARGLTLGTAESLTAGLVAATLADVPGCSAVLRGGIVAYDRSVKSHLLGIPADVLDRGLVSEPVALSMARGARAALEVDLAISTTGVAGPDAHDGEPVGSVWIALATGDGARARHVSLVGDRAEIRRGTVAACLRLVLEELLGE